MNQTSAIVELTSGVNPAEGPIFIKPVEKLKPLAFSLKKQHTIQEVIDCAVLTVSSKINVPTSKSLTFYHYHRPS